MGRARELALSLQASKATPKASEKAWIALATELETALNARNHQPRGARWVHASDRQPRFEGQYLTISFDSKSDTRIFGEAIFDGNFHPCITYTVAYWLEGLDVPVQLTPVRPDPRFYFTPVPMVGATRVERFVASLPTYRAGPKTRVRFLDAFAEFLENELNAPDIAPVPRWVNAAERLPPSLGRRGVVVKEPDGLFLGTVAFEERFLDPVPGRKILHWLDGLRCPPFYYQPSKMLQCEAPHPREVSPMEP